MECEHTHNVEESTAQTQGGIILEVDLTEHEKVLHFRSPQFGLEDQHAQKEYSGNEAVPCHCLICGVLCDIAESSHNVFGQLETSDSSRVSVFEKVGQILSRNLHSINLHSEVVCGRCFNLLIEYEETKCKLQTIRMDLVMKFDTTASKHHEGAKKVSEKQTELDDDNHKGDENHTPENSDIPRLVIAEESKVIDRNGKEKAAPVKRRIIRTSGKANVTDDVISKPYVCSACGKGFRAFSHRVEHMLIHLGEKPWNCGECKKTFRTRSALRVHSSKHSRERPYTCQQCGKSFLDRYYFEEHCRIHSGERPFVCTYCQRPFARKKDLAIHTTNHTGEKPHKCTSCPKTFAVKSRLDRHSRIHSGEKPHHCEYCDKSFARRYDYKVHVRLHTGERPFRCAVCSKTFTNQSNCLAHVRIHEGSKQRYPCPVCEESFDRRSKVDRHITRRHSDILNKEQPDSKAQGSVEPTAVQAMDTQIQNLTPVSLQPLAQVQVESLDTPALSHPDSFSQTVSQPLLHAETLQNLTVTDLHTLQTLPIMQVAQLEWSDGTAAGTTTAYVNITPATYVNIIN